MAKQFPALEPEHIAFIEAQHIFFTASAAPEGRVNLSPKGCDSLRVLSPNRILWRNLTGSGNETAGHLLQANRITLMWCSFTTRPLILRCYGTATATYIGEPEFSALDAHFPPHLGARQVFDVSIEMVQTSCGYGVPFFEHRQDRPTIDSWTDDRGPDGLAAYWQLKNATTIDGTPTGLPPKAHPHDRG